jgi:hypothetical protein
MNAIIPIPPGVCLPAALAPDLTRAAEWAREEKAAATRRAYRSDFRIFEGWCHGRGVSALPATAEAVAAFLAHDVKTGTRPIDPNMSRHPTHRGEHQLGARARRQSPPSRSRGRDRLASRGRVGAST